MDIVNISKKRFDSLEELELSKGIVSTESKIYKFPFKDKWNKGEVLFKKFYIDEGETFGNKLETVNNLMFYSDTLACCENLVLPEYMVSIVERIAGFTVSWVKGENMSLYLKNRDISDKDKVDCMIQAGEVLEKIKCIRNHTEVSDFYIGDLHEQNMVVDEEKVVRFIDLDSSSISQNKPFPVRYLATNSHLKTMPHKYPVKDGMFLISEETDLHAYNMMILNYIAGGCIKRPLDVEEFYSYLNYLDSLNIDEEILSSLGRTYSSAPNINPYEHIESLTHKDPRTIYPIFKNQYQKTKKL